MPNKSKSSLKLTLLSIRQLLQLQERTFKNFVESIVGSLTKRIDDLMGKVADLRASLEFSQKDIENQKTLVSLLGTNLQLTSVRRSLSSRHFARSSLRKQLTLKIKAVEITSLLKA